MAATLVREVPLPFAVAAAVRYEDQARFHPLKYLSALAQAVHLNGGRIYEGTRVVKVEAGEPCRVTTERGTVTADTVLFATHTPAGFSLLHAELEPYRSYVMAVKLRGGEPPEGLFFDTADPYNYTRRQGDLLIVGGKDHKTGEDHKPEESYRALEEYVRQRWDVESIDYRWSAQFYDPPDGLPMIGRAVTSKHVFLATGYSGTGMVFGTLGGMLMADFALGRENPWARGLPPIADQAPGGRTPGRQDEYRVGGRLRQGPFHGPQDRGISEIPAGEGRVVEIGGERAAVYRDESGAVQAVSPVCTHAGCLVHWNSAEKSWDCPCHGSRFAVDGGVLEGPAVKGLEPVSIPAPSRESRAGLGPPRASIRPDLLPPGFVLRRSLGGARLEVHLAADLVDVPAGEGGEGRGLLLVLLRQLAAILRRRLAGGVARPGVAQDEAPLEVLAVGGLLEHQVLGEVRGVVAQVETGEEDVLGAGLADPRVVPEDAELPQLVGGERIGRAGIAPAHVPGVLEEQRPHVLLPDLLVEHRLVEAGRTRP